MRPEGISSLPRRVTGITDHENSRSHAVWRAEILLLSALLLAAPVRAAEHGEKPAKLEGTIEGPTFVTLPPIVLPVFNRENKVTRQAGLVLALELEPGKTPADIEPNRHRVKFSQAAFAGDFRPRPRSRHRPCRPHSAGLRARSALSDGSTCGSTALHNGNRRPQESGTVRALVAPRRQPGCLHRALLACSRAFCFTISCHPRKPTHKNRVC